jgi:hypothetical protein
MAISKDNLKRIKNIVSGNIDAKNRTSIGYKQVQKDHVEGVFNGCICFN